MEKKPHNKDIYDVYSSPDIIRVIKSRRMRWAGYVVRMTNMRGACRALVKTLEGKIPLGSPKRGWKNNIKMDLHKVGQKSADWIDLAQDMDRWPALVNAVNKPSGSINCREFLEQLKTGWLAYQWNSAAWGHGQESLYEDLLQTVVTGQAYEEW